MKVKTTVTAVLALLLVSFTAGSGTTGAVEPHGLLRVTTAPSVPSQIEVDGIPRNTWGLDWAKFAPGSHQVCFGDVPGFTTPACQNVTVTAGATTTVTGTFTERGYLKVETVPDTPSRISVDGIPRDNWGVFTDIPAGTHQVCFGEVPDTAPPPCQTVTVTAGATTVVQGHFSTKFGVPGLTGVGLLRVTTDPAVPSQVTVDGQIANTWGLNWLELAAGTYDVCFGDVAGFTTPACEEVKVIAGQTANVVGDFAPRGYLQVTTDPAVASTITLDGEVMNDWGVYTDLAPGDYEVCFGDVVGYATPPCQPATLVAGATTALTGTPLEVGAGTWVELRTPDDTGSWLPDHTSRAGLVVGQGYYCTGSCTTSGTLQLPSGLAADQLAFETVGVDGAIAARTTGGGPATTYVWTSPTASPVPLTVPSQFVEVEFEEILPSGAVIGWGIEADDDRKPLHWTHPTATPVQSVTVPGAASGGYRTSFSTDGRLIGTASVGGTVRGWYMKAPGSSPHLLPTLPSFTDGVRPVSVNSSGVIVGYGLTADGMVPVAWPSPTAAPVPLELPVGVTTTLFVELSESGRIHGKDADVLPGQGPAPWFHWSSYSATPVVFEQPAGWMSDRYAGMLGDGTTLTSHSGGSSAWTPTGDRTSFQGIPGGLGPVVVGFSTSEVLYGIVVLDSPEDIEEWVVWTSVGATPTVVGPPAGYPSAEITGPDYFTGPEYGASLTVSAVSPSGNPVGFVYVP